MAASRPGLTRKYAEESREFKANGRKQKAFGQIPPPQGVTEGRRLVLLSELCT